MRRLSKDLWHYHARGAWVVITTNTCHSQGRAHMGKGLALDARLRFPGVEYRYGRHLQQGGYEWTDRETRLLLVPTKTDWRQPSNVVLVERALQLIVAWSEPHYDQYLAVPQLGCSNGQLDWETQVKPLCERYLTGRTNVGVCY